MNKISERQNNPKFIKYLKAQRVAYKQCKIHYLFDFISLIIAIILPIIGFINNDYVNYLGAFGVLWTIVYLISENYRKKKTEQGAKIQEQFDTELFDLPWNDILAKDKINADIVFDLAQKYDGNDLKNWYSNEIDPSIPHPIAVLLCQRINFSWELKLRKLYMLFLVLVLVVYYGTLIGLSITYNLGLYTVLLIIVPSLSFLIYGVQNSLSLKRNIKSKNDTLKQIDKLLEGYSDDNTLPNKITLRQIQDVIFTERSVPVKIPDWFYALFKSSNEERTDSIIKSIKAKL